MLNAKELRIGNLFTDRFGKIIPVESICECGINMSCGDGGEYVEYSFKWGDNPMPIVLTEEWLLKFGFSPIGTTSNIEYYTIGDYDFTFSFENGVLIFDNLRIKIEFAHQLQNLYFALTGEELTIKQSALSS